jgi:hypothetical protein
MADWDTETGLVEKFDGTVIDAWFEEGEYGVTLKLAIETPQADSELEQWYGCGSKGVQFVSDQQVDVSMAKNGRFNEQSGVGQLIKYVKASGLIDQIAGKGGPDEAASWKGLKARFEVVEVGTKQDGTPRKVTVPTGPFGGEAVADTGTDTEVTDIPAWLVAICEDADTYDAFMEAALSHESIDRATRKLVMDPTLWDFS